jgi:hypothetical protein
LWLIQKRGWRNNNKLRLWPHSSTERKPEVYRFLVVKGAKMTISARQRRQNQELSIAKIMEYLGEDCFDKSFGDSNPNFKEVLPTTWQELKRHGWIIQVQGVFGENARYELTGSGWIEGLRLTGKLQAPALRTQLIDLKTKLKALVKGRQREAAINLRQFSRESGISREWIYNVIESRLLSKLFPAELADLKWVDSCRGFMFEVPTDFGMKRI